MKCPACANTNATCVIGNYWQCPGVGCVNNNGMDSKTAKPGRMGDWALDTWGDWVVQRTITALKPSTKPAYNLYAGSPWLVGYHKAASDYSHKLVVGQARVYPTAQLRDTVNEARGIHSSPCLYAVELLSFDPMGGWDTKVLARCVP